MITITFNAFSFLQEILKERNLEYSNVKLEIEKGTTVKKLVERFELSGYVEAVFVNRRTVPFDKIIQDNDRVAFIPIGMPGPYRVFLGFISNKPKDESAEQ